MITALLLNAALMTSIPQPPQAASETIDVNVIEVNVVVVDARGKPVTGLQQRDFELMVGGKKREISNFYAVAGPLEEVKPPAAQSAPAPAPVPLARHNFVVVFVDNAHLHQNGKKRALEALRRFIAKNVGPATSAMIVTFDDGIDVKQTFTDDPARLGAVIDALERQPAKANSYENDRRDMIRMMEDAGANTILVYQQMMVQLAERERGNTQREIDALNDVIRSTSGLDGRRALVCVSDGLPMQPVAEMFKFYEKRAEETMSAGTPRFSNQIIANFNRSDALKTDLSMSFERLAKESATAGVQFFAIDAGGARGFDPTGADPMSDEKLDWNLIRANLHGPVQLLADETGGRAILDQNDLDAAFATLADDLTTYYSLGFRSDGSMKEESVSVRVRRPGMTAHATRTVRERTTRERIEQAVRSRLYVTEEQNPLGINLRLSRAGSRTVGVAVRVPLDALSIIPGREGETSGFDVYVTMMDENMRESPMQMVRHVVLPSESPEAVQWIYLHAHPGKYKVSFAVVDTLSWQTSFFQRELELGGAE